MKHIHFLVVIILLISSGPITKAQEGNQVFTSLRFPASARVNALGGQTVSLIEPDPSLTFHNPSLLGGEMDGMLGIAYMNHISGIHTGSAIYTRAHGERGAWAIGASYINYGSMKEVDAGNQLLGSFSAQDVNVNATYAYELSDRWRGGLTFKALYSGLAGYSSFGIAVDAGLSYYDSERQLSFGMAIKNVGAQLKAYDTRRQQLPWDIQLGISKKMDHAPLRFSLTAVHLNRWKFTHIDATMQEQDLAEPFGTTLLKHFVFGIDIIPSDNFWIGAGFNPKANRDMRLKEGGNGLGGFSIGAGLKIARFDVNASVARYHPSALSMMVGITTSLSSE